MARGPQLSGAQQHAGDEDRRPGVLLPLQHRQGSGWDRRGLPESAPDSTTDDPRWDCVWIKAVKPLKRAISLEECKVTPGLEKMVLVNNIASVGAAGQPGRMGTFLITPWVAMNYGFAMRKPALTVIDGVNSVVGCTIMGAVLNSF
jgi:hypothetical protein